MAYNDLSEIKKINGIPVDLNYFSKVTENDAFFKNFADTDEDLELLKTDILPITNKAYSIGTSSKGFLNGYIDNIISSKISLSTGSLVDPALKIANTGLASLSSNELSFILSSLEIVKLNSSGMTIKAANNIPLKIQNTSPGAQSQWFLGSNDSGFNIIDASIAQTLKILVGNAKTSFYTTVLTPNGIKTAPSFSFNEDPATGMYKDPGGPILFFSTSGSDKLSISSASLNVMSDKLLIPTGSATSPALSFLNNTLYGLSYIDESIGLILKGTLAHSFNQLGYEANSDSDLTHTRTVYSQNSVVIDDIRKGNGTKAIPLPVGNNSDLYIQRISANTDAGFLPVAEVGFFTSEDFSGGTYGTSMSFSTVPIGQAALSETLSLNSASLPTVNIPKSLGITTLKHSTIGTGQQINVSNVSKVMFDTTSGNIEVRGFIGGKEGQLLYLYKKVPTNTLTLLFNNGTATQKILLKGSVNYVNTNDYGGVTLSFDDGVWREVSRS